MLPNPTLNLSGERFTVLYGIRAATEAEALARANDIAVEQTVEFPEELTPPGDIRHQVVGRIESCRPLGEERYGVSISYAVETAGNDLPQLLNVIFGNSSIKPGLRVERLEFPPGLLARYRGPRFGRAGLRELLGVFDRPLLCTALKPMGLSPADLADLSYKCALGGIDIIKDDHGLADQPFAPFWERVQRCAEAVDRANRETGRRSIYMPNVTAQADRILEAARFARQVGAGGLLISPGLTGLDAMRQLADDDQIALPVMSHPALLGSFVVNPDSGISHYALFGQLARLAGADATIYPNWGGRFSFSKPECQAIADGTAVPMGGIRPVFPTPGGGMTLERIPELLEVYGREVIFLVGGGLFRQGPDLVENCRYFLKLIGG
ncbi:MAG TPA: RuBisCO large subunit C-terminal-like domain-containing protein [Symbiobacteriaceae bacterium]|nr:RuBisCO large subunit C-terminal-like domain-containing protein [Symbiobacteriaceae bacterium]